MDDKCRVASCEIVVPHYIERAQVQRDGYEDRAGVYRSKAPPFAPLCEEHLGWWDSMVANRPILLPGDTDAQWMKKLMGVLINRGVSLPRGSEVRMTQDVLDLVSNILGRRLKSFGPEEWFALELTASGQIRYREVEAAKAYLDEERERIAAAGSFFYDGAPPEPKPEPAAPPKMIGRDCVDCGERIAKEDEVQKLSQIRYRKVLCRNCYAKARVK